MSDLRADVDTFSRFFAGVWSTDEQTFEPFPWQKALAEEVLQGNGWPKQLRMPTGAGKTATLDLAVFHLATQARTSSRAREAPLRICYVIDRRIVVDEAYRRATELATALQESLEDPNANPIVRQVAAELQSLGARRDPLHVARMRGGIYREDLWAQSPTQPTICISTVDQVGSRLLFRGYGVSDSMKPVHAGLLGNDALYLLDEAHLSRPFEETLSLVQRYRRDDWAEQPPNTPFEVVSMSATISAHDDDWYAEETRRKDLDHPVLGPRLEATKKARLNKIKPRGDFPKQRKRLAHTVADEAMDLLDHDDQPRVIGIVVNRVRTARLAFERITNRIDEGDVILLTGRVRSIDRDILLNEYGERIAAGRDRNTEEQQPLFVVATQTIEVGADLDFDAMVTELAPLDSLRQRFGRLDRFGNLGDTPAVIVALHEYTLKRGSENEPIYGTALRSTWKWLKDKKQGRGKSAFVDMGILGAELPEDREQLAQLCAPQKEAPVLLPAHLDALVQTSPRPAPQIDIGVYLHGVDTRPADVHVVWRSDLDIAMLNDASRDEQTISIVNLLPPTTQETMRLSVGATQNWLRGQDTDLTDVEGDALDGGESTSSGKHRLRRVIRWEGPEDSSVVPIEKIRPGDTIVVPSEVGGADKFGFHPDVDEPVLDIAESARFLARKSLVLRLHPDVFDQEDELSELWTDEEVDEAFPDKNGDEAIESAALREKLQLLADSDTALGHITRCFAEVDDFDVIKYPTGTDERIPVALTTSVRPSELAAEVFDEDRTIPFDAEWKEDDTTTGQQKVGLKEHLEETREIAESSAKSLFGDGALAETLQRAARLHDIGKADPRFQAWLHRGDHVRAAAADKQLAKSDMNPRDRTTWNRARRLADYPEGYRHECLSVAMLTNHPILETDVDSPLLQFLIGSHHGYGRPFFPANSDGGESSEEVQVRFELDDQLFESTTNHDLFRLDSGWTEHFWNLVGKYGYWGLAHLEAVVRLADHEASRQAEEIDEF